MKKILKSIIAVALCLFVGFGLTACMPKNIDKATSRLEKAGYTIVAYGEEAEGSEADGYVGSFVASNVENVNDIDGMMAILFDSKKNAKAYFEQLTEEENKSMFGKWVLDGKWVYTGSMSAIKAFK